MTKDRGFEEWISKFDPAGLKKVWALSSGKNQLSRTDTRYSRIYVRQDERGLMLRTARRSFHVRNLASMEAADGQEPKVLFLDLGM